MYLHSNQATPKSASPLPRRFATKPEPRPFQAPKHAKPHKDRFGQLLEDAMVAQWEAEQLDKMEVFGSW